MTVRIVTDSACDLTEEETVALDIDVVPLSIRFGEVEYIDRKELSVPDFYEEMSTNEHLLKLQLRHLDHLKKFFKNALMPGQKVLFA